MVMLKLCVLIITIVTLITITQSILLKVTGIVEKKIDERKIKELKMAINECCTVCTKPQVLFTVYSMYVTYSCYDDGIADSNRITSFNLAKANFTHDICDGYLENVEFNGRTLQLIINCCLSIYNEYSTFKNNDYKNETSSYITKLFIINYDFKFYLEQTAHEIEKATRIMRIIWIAFGIFLIILKLFLLINIIIKCRHYFKV
ncbi:putative 2,3-bisphosphoglycerate-independent phosphoglycerate mutase [Dirofilaria immitis]